MKLMTKSVLATVCLTGNLTVDSVVYFAESDARSPTYDHHISFGMNSAFASDSDDGDDEARQVCQNEAQRSYDDCVATAMDVGIGWEDMVFNCKVKYSMDYIRCQF
jgi:hypothetical protein